ncbi:hypothetical protein K6119_17375 [Paracrocinitomix mangrovi]|uniref:hypothetical protein n=1 Tax=Paracrocinitomix mangrovi TaxID=2862509 RepID=UPI001C8D593B|nr:hypothetical protein [Paracrocinitomix mangrovi]UKN01498.1 hypothetical protein K6119_17375 [Paracrocinitomix mangrovi]
MKKAIIGLSALGVFLVMLLLFAFAKETELAGDNKFRVVHVEGKIVFVKSNKEMKRGDTYIAGTTLNFETSKSRAAVINESKGRFVLTGNSRGKVRVLPAANNISARGGALLNAVDLKNHFEGRYLILDRTELEIGRGTFPMNDSQFFYLTYPYKGEEIAKQLPYNDNKLIFDKTEIFKVDGNPIPVEEKEMTLYYRQNGKGTKVNSFTPVFPDLLDLKEEVLLILESLESKSFDEQKKEVSAHLNEFYGKVNMTDLTVWMEKEFKKK